MQAGNAQIGRTILAALTAAVLVMSMVFLLANPAEANHIPDTGAVPSYCVEFQEGQTGPKSPPDYPGVTINVTSWADTPGDPHTVNFTISGLEANQFVTLSVKSGGNVQEPGPYGNGTHSFSNDLQNAISHVRLCVFEEEPTTTTSTTVPEETTTVPEETTTTVPEETTTTVPEETTTTVPEETTTTVPEETTTTVPEETTTTIPDEVLALVFVTVDGKCVVDDGKGEGRITVTISVDDAATVVIKDGDGDVVATVTEDSVVTVPEDDTYTWEATPNEGFEFAEDFVSTGEVDIDACTPDEVKDLEVLPFTGAETEALAVIAAVLSGIGLLVLLATRRVEE
jgi:hypothetical protein